MSAITMKLASVWSEIVTCKQIRHLKNIGHIIVRATVLYLLFWLPVLRCVPSRCQ